MSAPSPLSTLLTESLTSSSGVDAALINAGPAAMQPNALTEQLSNLELPETQSIFAPANSWDYQNPYTLSSNPNCSGITADAATQAAACAGTSSIAALPSLSLFGLSSGASWLLLGAAALLLMTVKHRRR